MSDNAEITPRLRAAGGDPSRPLPPTPSLSPAADRRATELARRDAQARNRGER